MSRRHSRIECSSTWFLVLAAAAAICLQGRTTSAQLFLQPAYPVATRPASPTGTTVSDLTPGDEDGQISADADLTLELLAPDAPSNAPVTVPRASSELTAARLAVAASAPDDDEAEQAAEDDDNDQLADDAAEDGSATSPTPVELTPELEALREKIRGVLGAYYPRHQNARDNNAWEIMHAIVAYGVDTQIFKNGPGGEKVNAMGWLCYNYPCAGYRMLLQHNGKLEARRGVGVQGHHGQFLAILAQSRLKPDYPMYVGGKDFTIADLIEFEKQNCFAGEELTFKLIALMHYLDSDATWTSRDGQPWSIQRLIREELAQPIRGAACGGTHRLMGFSYAVNKRIKRGEPVSGEFRRAQIFMDDYHRYTFGLQNRDGSFSTEWFERKGANPDIDRRIKTSGHILEWMAFSVPDETLRQPKMVQAVDYVASLLAKHNRRTWEIGPLGHALHGLVIYDERVFKPHDPPASQTIVEADGDSDAAIEARRDVESTR